VSTSEQDPFSLEDEYEKWVPPTPGPASEPEPESEPESAPANLDEEGGNGFHVVPLDEPPPPVPSPSPTPSAPARPTRAVDEDTGIDTRTVAERRGDAVAMETGKRPPPEGWPGEAFAFPLRKPGLQTIAGAAIFLMLLDLLSRANFFLGLLFKLFAVIFFLRWQLHVASKTAAGHDVPAGWAGAVDMSRERLRGIGILLVAALLLVLPGVVADLLERPALAVVLFLAGGVLLAAGALSQVVGDPTLMRPWNVLAWIARRPLGLLAATAGWWAAGWTEILLWWMRDASTGAYLAASLGLRLVGMYLWLLSARALGVVGRSWSLFDDEDDDEEDDDEVEAATSPAG